jgi:alpha-glucan, water dikinase
MLLPPLVTSPIYISYYFIKKAGHIERKKSRKSLIPKRPAVFMAVKQKSDNIIDEVSVCVKQERQDRFVPLEKIVSDKDIALSVAKSATETAVKIDIQIEGDKKCILHWGMQLRGRDTWAAPPRPVWPEGTTAFDGAAVRTPFSAHDGKRGISITIGRSPDLLAIDFALFFPDEGSWDNNGGRNYRIDLPPSESASPLPWEVLERETGKKEVSHKRLYELAEGRELALAVWKEPEDYVLGLVADLEGPLLLHWGISVRSRLEWDMPPEAMLPAGSEAFDRKAVRTPFADRGGLRRLTLKISAKDAPSGISFVLYQPGTGRWFKDRGRNFYVPLVLSPEPGSALGSPELSDLADEIVGHETGRNSWTLMHRFNLCYDLLDRVKNNADALALIFVWLRFSAIRQLDWQRNYNTKPRELGHAMDRLTLKLAGCYTAEPGDRELIRLIFTTLGRGSDAQRVRDEVLNIMHRRHIKEVSGHFMEEWHQKLHNNATPDDIVICEAYLAFLKSNGNLDRFYERLNEGGLTRERLESYERPIVSHPDFVPHLKDDLISDFEHFLGILKEVHSGTDLGTAIHSARYLFGAEMNGLMDHIWRHRDDRKLVPFVQKIIEGRRRLKGLMKGHADRIRDLLFLDIALEDFSRIAVERNLAAGLGRDELADLIEALLEIMTLSAEDEELRACLRHWRRLAATERFSKDWALHADSVIDRIQRSIGSFIDRYYRLLQPKAEFLGRAFTADTWTVTLFGEEVVRGMPAFALSMLLRKLNPILREAAELGDWQIISPGRAEGYVEVTDSLKSVQGKRFARKTVIISDRVAGDEEIPEAVVAIITPDSTDVLAHVAIRARNAGVLFAVCYNAEKLDGLKKLRGTFASLGINAAGEVLFEHGSPGREEEIPLKRTAPAPLSAPSFSAYAVSLQEFTEDVVGGKSLNIKKMQGRLPDWIHLPASAAIPFGIFEKVLGTKENEEVAGRCEELIDGLGRSDEHGDEGTLGRLRNAILDLKAPEELSVGLKKVMTESGFPWPEWDGAWTCIKKVWASKWNTRAYLSRVARGIAHQDLYMAVLVQRIVEADYSYVIHTVNPFSGNRDEIYAEAVLGLGEALVGNYPGRALSFLCGKSDKAPRLLSYPGKSIGLFGEGLTFRSDSNGEDLAEYAGAGLYDSFMLPEPRRVILDYTDERIVWDRDFRRRFMTGVAAIGELVETALGGPQDIEGAFSGEEFYVVQARPQVGLRND